MGDEVKGVLSRLRGELMPVFEKALKELPEHAQISCKVDIVLPPKLSHIDVTISLDAREEVVWVREHDSDMAHIAPDYQNPRMLCGFKVPGSPFVTLARECPEDWRPCQMCEAKRDA